MEPGEPAWETGARVAELGQRADNVVTENEGESRATGGSRGRAGRIRVGQEFAGDYL
jgi:hypothetical protein